MSAIDLDADYCPMDIIEPSLVMFRELFTECLGAGDYFDTLLTIYASVPDIGMALGDIDEQIKALPERPHYILRMGFEIAATAGSAHYAANVVKDIPAAWMMAAQVTYLLGVAKGSVRGVDEGTRLAVRIKNQRAAKHPRPNGRSEDRQTIVSIMRPFAAEDDVTLNGFLEAGIAGSIPGLQIIRLNEKDFEFDADELIKIRKISRGTLDKYWADAAK